MPSRSGDDPESRPDSTDAQQTDTDGGTDTTNTPIQIHETVRVIFGFAGCVIFFHLVIRSLEENFTLDPHVVAGMIALIAFLLAGPKGFEALLDAWRGQN